MEPFVIGIIGVIILLFLVFIGVHVAFALGIVGIIGIFAVSGIDRGLSMIASTSFYSINSVEYTVIPLFILMGMLATSVGASTAAYDTGAKWLGRVRDGLGVATVVGCTAFGTLNGWAVVTASVFGKASVPEMRMRKYGYDKRLAYGLVCGAGCIGQLIPPSVLIVIYGALSGDSIGRLLMAGISPGLALALGFSLYVIAMAYIRPDMVPVSGQKYSWNEKMKSLTGLIPIAIAAFIIIGGIFTGFCSSSEAGAIGCVVFFIYALIRRVSWSKVKESLIETVATCGMLFIILVSASIFAKFLTITHLADMMVGLVTTYPLPPVLFMLGCSVIYLVLGCLLDAISILSLSLPILLPVVDTLGIDRIQFAMFAILALHCGMLTPPVGTACFAVKGVASEDTSLGDIFREALPFLIVMIVVTILFILFPGLSTFLPNLMM